MNDKGEVCGDCFEKFKEEDAGLTEEELKETPGIGKCILKAMKNGWDGGIWDSYNGGMLLIGWPFDLELLLGNHEFAKALWGDTWKEKQHECLTFFQAEGEGLEAWLEKEGS